MRQYLRNVWLWLAGFRRFDAIDFQPGWSATSFWWWVIYALNYGPRVLTGGAVMTWSRWFFLNRRKYGIANFITRFLDHLDQDHGRKSADALWQTVDTPWAARGAVAFWGVVVPLVLWGLAKAVAAAARFAWSLAT
jgi:hypothetical protein